MLRLHLFAQAVGCSTALSCIASPADACHDRLLAEQGCCPFHAGDCELPRDVIEEACAGARGLHDASRLPPGAASAASTTADGEETRGTGLHTAGFEGDAPAPAPWNPSSPP